MDRFRSENRRPVADANADARYAQLLEILDERILRDQEQANVEQMQRAEAERRLKDVGTNQSMIAPATETSPAMKGGKGKGKANGKGAPKGGGNQPAKDAPQKGSGAQVPNHVRRNLCKWFVVGNCKKGADCRYEHSKAANFNEQKYYTDLMVPKSASSSTSGSSSKGGSSSRAQSPGKKGVCKFFAKGHCRMGDRCHYEHRKSPSAPASESKGSGR